MKSILLTFLLLFNFSAFGAGDQKTNTTMKNPPTAKPSGERATQLDDLIRGELAALKTYDKVLADTTDKKQKEKLQKIRNDHEKAVSVLSKYVAGKPELLEDTNSAGPWGTFTKAYTKTATLIGNETALKALKQGEEHGINEYNEALEDETLSAKLKDTIRKEFLPNQKKHIETLNTFM